MGVLGFVQRWELFSYNSPKKRCMIYQGFPTMLCRMPRFPDGDHPPTKRWQGLYRMPCCSQYWSANPGSWVLDILRLEATLKNQLHMCMGITFIKCRLGSKTYQMLAEKMLEYETYAHAHGTTHQNGRKQSLICVSIYIHQNGQGVPITPLNWLQCPDHSQGGICGKSPRARLLESQGQALWVRRTQVWKGWDLGPASAKLQNMLGSPTPANIWEQERRESPLFVSDFLSNLTL